MPGVRDLAIIVSGEGSRLATALSLAAAAAALGGDVAMLFDGASVTALAGPDEAVSTARDLGVRIVACQTGLADAGMTAADLPAGVTTGGMVSFLAAVGTAQVMLA